MTDMGEVTRAVSASLLFALVVWPSTGSTASSVPRRQGGVVPENSIRLGWRSEAESGHHPM
jgi:hypothetical protein